MKIETVISFNQGEAKYEQVRRLLESIDCAEGLRGLDTHNPGYYWREFEGNDPKLKALRAVLRKARFKWDETVNHIYDDAELRVFPFLRLWFNGRTVSGGQPKDGTEYDVSDACPRCGTGAVQTSALMVPPTERMGTGLLCQTHTDHVLVARELAVAFRKAGVSGLELRQARSQRGNKPLPWWQMISTYTMPRMGKQTKGIVREVDSRWGCPVCERDMYGMEPPTEIMYERSQVGSVTLPDVVQTWECFGRSILEDDPERNLGRGFAQPLLLVNVKVFDIFRRLKVKHADFQPVRIV
jgi:rubredoxin